MSLNTTGRNSESDFPHVSGPSRVLCGTLADVKSWSAEEVFDFVRNKIAHPLPAADEEKFRAENINGTALFKYGKDFGWWRKYIQLTAGAISDIIDLVESLDEAQFLDSAPSSAASDPKPEYESTARDLGATIKRLAVEGGWNIQTLADSSRHFHLPFPAIGSRKSRFQLVDGKFEYVGRAKIRELYSTLLQEDKSMTQPDAIHLYGTEGYGRSYIVAATVILLMAKGKRVVYIPDCSNLLSGSVREIRRALYVTFHDKPRRQAKVRTLMTTEALEGYLVNEYNGNLIFIFDNYEALQEPQQQNWDAICSETRESIRHLIDKISVNSQRLFVSAADDWLWRSLQANWKAENKKWLEWVGGFTKEEVATWWALQTDIPAGFDKKGLEYMTGRVPSFLQRAVQALPNWTAGINQTYTRALAFSKDIEMRMIKHEHERIEHHYQIVEDTVLMQKTFMIDHKVFDYRYFYHDKERRIFATAPFLLRAAQRALYNKNPHRLTMVDFVGLIAKMKGNPSVVGFAAEGATIANIGSEGLQAVDSEMRGPVQQRTFSGPYPVYGNGLDQIGRYMYVPEAFNFPAIDFLLLRTIGKGRSKTTHSVRCIPVQVTLNYGSHSDSEKHFFQHVRFWVKELRENNWKVEYFFAWVTSDGGINEVVAANALGFEHPKFTRIHVSFKDVNPRIDQTLRQINAFRSVNQKTQRKKAKQGSPELESPVGTPEPEKEEDSESQPAASKAPLPDPAITGQPASESRVESAGTTWIGKKRAASTNSASKTDTKPAPKKAKKATSASSTAAVPTLPPAPPRTTRASQASGGTGTATSKPPF